MAANIQEAMLRKMSPVLLPSQINPAAQFFQDEDWCGNKTKSNGRHFIGLSDSCFRQISGATHYFWNIISFAARKISLSRVSAVLRKYLLLSPARSYFLLLKNDAPPMGWRILPVNICQQTVAVHWTRFLFTFLVQFRFNFWFPVQKWATAGLLRKKLLLELSHRVIAGSTASINFSVNFSFYAENVSCDAWLDSGVETRWSSMARAGNV